MKNLQRLPRGPRLVIFILLMMGGLFLIAAFVVFLILLSVNSAERRVAFPVAEGVTIAEYASIPGEDIYPATVAVSPEGTVYTASYATGTVWRIDPDGVAVPVPGSAERIGSVTALAFAPDGTLYILDRLTADFRSQGGAIWALSPQGDLDAFGDLDAVDVLAEPQDAVVDSFGSVYVLDRSRREVWRYDPSGSAELWWEPPPDDPQSLSVLPNGIAYDSASSAIVITDTELDTIYRVSLDGQNSEIVYRYDSEVESGDAPGFDGVTVAADGAIYAAASVINAVVRVDPGAGLTVIAGNFRGASDVAYADGRLYVSNFDSRSLVVPGVNPQLPFALDVIEFE